MNVEKEDLGSPGSGSDPTAFMEMDVQALCLGKDVRAEYTRVLATVECLVYPLLLLSASKRYCIVPKSIGTMIIS